MWVVVVTDTIGVTYWSKECSLGSADCQLRETDSVMTLNVEQLCIEVNQQAPLPPSHTPKHTHPSRRDTAGKQHSGHWARGGDLGRGEEANSSTAQGAARSGGGGGRSNEGEGLILTFSVKDTGCVITSKQGADRLVASQNTNHT